MRGIGIATDHFRVSADAFCRTISALLGIGRSAAGLTDHVWTLEEVALLAN